MGEYLQALFNEASIYHFRQKAILKNTAGQDDPFEPHPLCNAAAGLYRCPGNGSMETTGQCCR